MKRYETLSKEQIIKAYNSTLVCADCILNAKCDEDKISCSYPVPCAERIAKYLREELVPIPRWKKIKCNDDLLTLYSEYNNKRNKLNTPYDFVTFLLQNIPNPEE